MKRIVLAIGIVTLIGLGFAGWIIWKLERRETLSAPSPSGRFVAKGYSLGEGGNPPYGSSVEITTVSILSGMWNSVVVFSAYCDEPLTLVWKSEEELRIRCINPEKEMVRRILFQQIRIAFDSNE